MSTFREENTRYLRPMWIRAGIIYLVLIAVLVYSVANWPANLGGPWPLAVGAALGLGIVFLRRRRRKGLVERALANTSADAAARGLFGQYLNTPGKAVVPIVTIGAAQVHAIYGNFARAEELLAQVDWEKEPPLLRGDQHFVRAIMEHIKGNHQAAIEQAAVAFPMMELSPLFPGTARLRRSLAYLEALGKVLANDDREAAQRLADPRLTRSSKLQRGIATWALATAESRQGNHAMASKFLAESRSLMPHAYGLGVPRPVEVAPPAKHDADNPYAAPSTEAVDQTPFEARRGKVSFLKRNRLLVVGLWALLLVAAHTYLSCIARQH